MRSIIINGAFVGQQVTGQQRYATEVAKRLINYPGVNLIRPRVNTNSGRTAPWLWAQGLSLRSPRATLLSMTARAPVFRPNHVVVVHDVFPLTNPEWYTKAYISTHAPILKHHLRHARGILAVSPSTRDALAPWLRKGMPVALAPNGLTPEVVNFGDRQADSVLRQHNLLANSYIICVGSIDPRKNIGRLISAYSTLNENLRKEHPLVTVGASDSKIFAGTDDRTGFGIRHLGRVSDEELAVLYSRARAFILPSLDEGFGIPVLEAAAHRLPLLLSDIPVFRWLTGGADGVRFFDPLSERSIADALMATFDPAEQLVRRHHSTLARFDWKTTTDGIYDFLSGI